MFHVKLRRKLLAAFSAAIAVVGHVSNLPAGQRPVSTRPASQGQVGNLPHVTPSPIHDDANLRDVTFVGGRTGWAVGDRGVIWHTTDGGTSWSLQKSPVDCPLRSVCFLTDRVGWVVGGGTQPHTRLTYGVVLFTSDGGRHWELLSRSLPPLFHVRFFPRSEAELGNEGVAVGEASADYPSGVLVTRDGGRTWKSVPGGRSSGWRAAAFLRPDTGVAAGLRGRLALVGGGRMITPRVDRLGLRAVRGAVLQKVGRIANPSFGDASGWLVGDGGLVLQTRTGGVSWQSPPAELPRKLLDMTDFHAVAARGDHVWIAGEPGSAIWHSPDRGRTWQPQPTGQTAPVYALHFRRVGTAHQCSMCNDQCPMTNGRYRGRRKNRSSVIGHSSFPPSVGDAHPTDSGDLHGWAVGALGTILRTSDGGATWQAVRGGGRRAALLAVHARPARVPFALLAQLGAEDGYRSVVLLPARHDVGPDGHAFRSTDHRLDEAVAAAGGSAAVLGWRFPLAVPGLEHDVKKLADDWNRRTDGRLREALLGRLVARIRTWRPSVLVLDQPARDDATCTLLNEAVLQAVRQAADPTRFIHHAELAQLEPWQVRRVYLRLPSGSTGNAHVEMHELLPRAGETVQAVAERGANRLNGPVVQQPVREAYRLVYEHGGAVDQSVPDAAVRDHRSRGFFTALNIAPDSDARRPLPPFDAQDYERRLALARRRRNVQAAAGKFLDDSRFAGQLIAQLKKITAGMNDSQAAAELTRLAGQYRESSQWKRAEETLIELIERFPDEPAAHQAMLWLFQHWSGAEPAWQRLREMRLQKRQVQIDGPGAAVRLERALQRASAAGSANSEAGRIANPSYTEGLDPIDVIQQAGDVRVGAGGDLLSETHRHRQDLAVRMAALIRRRNPALFRDARVQFPLAALMRGRGVYRLADGLLRRFEHTAADAGRTADSSGADGGDHTDAWQQTARSELWLLAPNSLPPKKIAACKRAAAPPKLDGVLSDACWQGAVELPLTASPGAPADSGRYAFVMLAWDAEYLYVAASVPREPDAPADRPVAAGRTHDADLSRFDRIALHLDVDRDYATWYTLEIDQRGWTRDACWKDQTWNPDWFVAADADDSHWRIEAAVPWSELAPSPPAKRSIWAVGVVRTIPATGLESWTHPASSAPRPETFGLLRFE